MFGFEVLLDWIGIRNVRQIILTKYSKAKNIQEVYKKAEEINRKIGYKVLQKEYIDNILLEIQREDRNEYDEPR